MNASPPRESFGILLYRKISGRLEVMLVHPGGPYWARKDDGAWSIPKGERDPGEEALVAAKREFAEEVGLLPEGDATPLGAVRQPGGKTVHAWAIEGDFDVATLKSNTFMIEWPPQSGTQKAFPEVDRAAWLSMEEARRRILKGQVPFLDRLLEKTR